MDAIKNTTTMLSPRLQRAMEAAKARGLSARVVKSDSGPWVSIADASGYGVVSVFSVGHILTTKVQDKSPGELVTEALWVAEHARVILAAADGVTP